MHDTLQLNQTVLHKSAKITSVGLRDKYVIDCHELRVYGYNCGNNMGGIL
jgi:hypothetical protein